jgi:hypothetical protein
MRPPGEASGKSLVRTDLGNVLRDECLQPFLKPYNKHLAFFGEETSIHSNPSPENTRGEGKERVHRDAEMSC